MHIEVASNFFQLKTRLEQQQHQELTWREVTEVRVAAGLADGEQLGQRDELEAGGAEERVQQRTARRVAQPLQQHLQQLARRLTVRVAVVQDVDGLFAQRQRACLTLRDVADWDGDTTTALRSRSVVMM